MHSNKLTAKVASAAIVVLIPVATLSAGASAAPKHGAQAEGAISIGADRGGPNAWLTRLSGLPFGGAALFDGAVPYSGTVFYGGAAAPAALNPTVPNSRSTRLSGLPFGGAALFV